MTARDVDVDVVVVGAGPSGSVVAHTAASAGLSVLCLEQGDWINANDYPVAHASGMWELIARTYWDPEPSRRHNEADYPIGLEDSDLGPGLFAAVGGASIHFGGVWPRFTPGDFRLRTTEGLAEDWPVTYDDLVPYFDETDRKIGVSGLGGDPAYPEGLDYPQSPLPLGRAGLRHAEALNTLGWHWWPGPNAISQFTHADMSGCARWGTCAQGCPEGAKGSFDRVYWPAAIRAGARLTTGATVAAVTVDADGRADGVRWLDSEGKEHVTRARTVVLCANAIGTPRILLMSATEDHPDGLANSSGLVGRNLMMHPTRLSYGYYADDLETWRGPVGSIINSMEFYDTDPEHDFVRGFKLEFSTQPGLIMGGVEPHRTLGYDELWGDAFHDVLSSAMSVTRWASVVEDLPSPDNRVTLDPDLRDRWGLPAPAISYAVDQNSERALAVSLERMREIHEAAGAEKVVEIDDVRGDPGHLLGTARMGNDPATSVVDEFGRTHDVPGLVIADGSTFVTGGSANPTSTIVALALRSARQLVADLQDEVAS